MQHLSRKRPTRRVRATCEEKAGQPRVSTMTASGGAVKRAQVIALEVCALTEQLACGGVGAQSACWWQRNKSGPQGDASPAYVVSS